MSEVKISTEQAKILLAHAETKDIVARLLRDNQVEDSVNIVGTPDEFDELRDHCSDLLLRIGFDENYVATSVGNMLESLIDKLYLGKL